MCLNEHGRQIQSMCDKKLSTVFDFSFEFKSIFVSKVIQKNPFRALNIFTVQSVLMAFSESALDSIVKVEPERFEDEKIFEKPCRKLYFFEECQLDQIQKCSVCLYE